MILDVKKFWSLSKSILGSKSQHCIPPLIENSSTISDDVHKAEIFNEFFSSHTRLDDTNPPPLPQFELLSQLIRNINSSLLPRG